MQRLVVVIVLSICLTGATYVVKQRGEQIRKNDAIAANDSNTDLRGASQDINKANHSNDIKNPAIEGREAVLPSSDLPKTGNGIDWASIVAIFSLGVACASYTRSRIELARCHLFDL